MTRRLWLCLLLLGALLTPSDLWAGCGHRHGCGCRLFDFFHLFGTAPTNAAYTPGCNPCTETTRQRVQYVARTAYRRETVEVPVTTYRRCRQIDCCTGETTTALRPVTTTVRRVVYTPYTVYQAVSAPMEAATTVRRQVSRSGCTNCGQERYYPSEERRRVRRQETTVEPPITTEPEVHSEPAATEQTAAGSRQVHQQRMAPRRVPTREPRQSLPSSLPSYGDQFAGRSSLPRDRDVSRLREIQAVPHSQHPGRDRVISTPPEPRREREQSIRTPARTISSQHWSQEREHSSRGSSLPIPTKPPLDDSGWGAVSR